MKKTTTKSTVPGGVLVYHLVKNLVTIGCFTYLSVYFGSVWIVLLALLFTGSLNNGSKTECIVEEDVHETQPNTEYSNLKDGWKEGTINNINWKEGKINNEK